MKSTKFLESNGLSGEGVLKRFQSRPILVDLEGFYNKTSTIGWTTLYGFKTHINTKFLDTFNEGEVFGHICHEWAHILGFAHRAFLWSNKYKSVPYRTGYLTRDLFTEYHSVKRPESFDKAVPKFEFIFRD